MPWDILLIFFVLGVVVPWRGRKRLQQLLAKPHVEPAERLSLYWSTIAFQWIAAVVGISDATALLAHAYYGVRRRRDCDIAMAEPATHGALDEPTARAASGFGGTHSSAKHEGVSSLSCIGSYRGIMRGILVPGICDGSNFASRLADCSGDFVIFYSLWTGTFISGPSRFCEHHGSGAFVRDFTCGAWQLDARDCLARGRRYSGRHCRTTVSAC